MEQILRILDIIEITSLSRSAIRQKIRSGTFPPALQLGTGRAVGWRISEIEAWMQELKPIE